MKNNFLDIRNHGFFRTAVVSPRVFLADPMKNAVEHVKWIRDLDRKGVQLIAFPELSISGYSCQDLLLSETLQTTSLDGLKIILKETKTINSLVVLGMPLNVGDRLFNTAVVILKGRILAVIPKTYLPDYREFRETRWFATANHVQGDEIEIVGQKVPFGTDLLIGSSENSEMLMGVDICEDLWMPIPPSTLAALAGATVLVNLSGSNITLTKDEYRRELVSGSSSKNIAAQLYASAGFGESTTDVAWDGHGMIADRGNILAETERYSMEGSFCVADIDLKTLVSDRLRMSSYRDNSKDYEKAFRKIVFDEELGLKESDVYKHFERNISSYPFVPQDPKLRVQRCREVFMIQATSLARRLEVLPVEKRKVTIGVSGGLDSTQALLVAAKTMDLLKLPRSNIVGITMPGFGTSDRTYQNAVDLIRAVGATFKEISIKEVSKLIFKSVGHSENKHDITFENTQAWSRKYVELATASEEGGIVLGTGDLSELWLGWCTMYGDHASHYGINSSVPKTLISHLVAFVAEEEFKDPKTQKILLDILKTPISPELLPLDEQKIVQKTEDIVGPYELHDFFGYYLVRFGMKPSKIARMAFHAFADKYEIGEIKKWLQIFLKRFLASQYKRSVLPDGPKVGSVSPSPRDEWRMPSDLVSFDTWLVDLEQIREDPLSGIKISKN